MKTVLLTSKASINSKRISGVLAAMLCCSLAMIPLYGCSIDGDLANPTDVSADIAEVSEEALGVLGGPIYKESLVMGPASFFMRATQEDASPWRIVSIQGENGDGSVEEYSTYEYSDDGTVQTERSVVYSDRDSGEIDYISTNIIDLKTRTEARIRENHSGSALSAKVERTTLAYNERGDMVGYKDEKGPDEDALETVQETTTEYLYDDADRRKTARAYKSGELILESVDENDENGRTVRYTLRRPQEGTCGTDEFTYDDRGAITSHTHVGDEMGDVGISGSCGFANCMDNQGRHVLSGFIDMLHTFIYAYDEHGNRIEEMEFSGGELSSHTVNIYDENNDLLVKMSCSETDESSPSFRFTTYDYENPLTGERKSGHSYYMNRFALNSPLIQPRGNQVIQDPKEIYSLWVDENGSPEMSGYEVVDSPQFFSLTYDPTVSVDNIGHESVVLENCTWPLPSTWTGKVDIEYNEEGDGARIIHRKTGQPLLRFQMVDLEQGFENIELGPEERLYMTQSTDYGRGAAVIGNRYSQSTWDALCFMVEEGGDPVNLSQRDIPGSEAINELLSLQTAGNFDLSDVVVNDADMAASMRFEESVGLFVHDHIWRHMRF